MSDSLAANPAPVTVSEVPGAPLVRFREIAGPVTKVTSAMPLAAVPEALMVWLPAGEAGTVKVADHAPWALAATPEDSAPPS
jgi:hypothetical protein